MKNKWTFALYPLWLIAAFAVLFLSVPGPAYAANCGGVNKRPCTVFERIPSCNKGLVENFAKGKCVRPKKPKPIARPKPGPVCGAQNQRPCLITERIPSCNRGLVENFQIRKCVKPAPPKRIVCGAQNQRPCLITERIPSCNKGLVENFQIRKCVKPAPPKRVVCGAKNQRPCLITERIPSCNRGLVENFRLGKCIGPKRVICGGVNRRPCLIIERIPSCNAGLVEDFKLNKCVLKSKLACGAQNQRPCLIIERIPSCDKGLVEYLNGKCLKPICGALNQGACQIGERIPSCNKGLRESLGKCIVLKPGEIPIFATIGEWSSELARVAEGECIKALSGFKGSPAAIGGISRIEPEQSRYFKIGFTCAALTQLDQLSGATAMIQEMNRQMQIEPCVGWISPLRPVCAFYHTSVVSFGAVAQCAMSLAVEKAVGGVGGGGSVKQTWLGLGKLAWSVKQMAGGGKKKDKNKKKSDKAKATEKKSAMDHFLKAHRLQIKFTAKAQKVLNGPMCARIN